MEKAFLTYVRSIETGLQKNNLGKDEQWVESLTPVVRPVDGHGEAVPWGSGMLVKVERTVEGVRVYV